jgi:hypothetical protein
MSVQSDGTFGVALCYCCKEFRTNHHCLAQVLIGSFSLENNGQNERVCGLPICSICSSNFGNEGIYWCEHHSNDDEDEDSRAEEVETNTNPQNNPPPEKTMTKKATKTNKAVRSSGGSSSNKANKSVEYTAKDLLVLAQAFIRTSENSIDGVSQKRSTFWEEVTKCFHKLKESQQAYDRRQKKKVRYTEVRLHGDFQLSDSEDDSDCELPNRTTSLLQQKWTKFLLPNVTKFIALTEKHPMQSGEGKLICFLCHFVSHNV